MTTYMRFLTVLALATAISGCAISDNPVGALAPSRATPAEQSADIVPYAVKINLPKDSGSGVVIKGGNGISLILTCSHVITSEGDTAKSAKITHNGKTVIGDVIANDPKLDLALLEVKDSWPVAPMYLDPVIVGEPDLVVGYPLNFGIAITSGFIGQMFNRKDGDQQESASMWPGNSGGGVFVYRHGWKLAGISEAVMGIPIGPMGMHQLAPSVAFFIPMASIQKFLQANHI